MSWLGDKILKIGVVAAVLGGGSAALKDTNKQIDNSDQDKGKHTTEQVVEQKSVSIESEKNSTPTSTKKIEKEALPIIDLPILVSSAKVENNSNSVALKSEFTNDFINAQRDRLVAEISQLQIGDLLEKNIVSKEFLASYRYSIEDVKEMRNNAGDDARKLEKSFKKWRSGKNYGKCLGGVKEIFSLELGVNIPCENNVRWASKAQLDEVDALFYMGTYDKYGKGNISKETMRQSAHVVTQFNKGKNGQYGHIGYNCFLGDTQYEYSDGRQYTSSSLNKMGKYYGPTCKVYGLKTTKVPKAMAELIVDNILAKETYLTMFTGDIFIRLGLENKQESSQVQHFSTNSDKAEKRIKKAKIKSAKRRTLADMRSADIKQQHKYAVNHYNRQVKSGRS